MTDPLSTPVPKFLSFPPREPAHPCGSARKHGEKHTGPGAATPPAQTREAGPFCATGLGEILKAPVPLLLSSFPLERTENTLSEPPAFPEFSCVQPKASLPQGPSSPGVLHRLRGMSPAPQDLPRRPSWPVMLPPGPGHPLSWCRSPSGRSPTSRVHTQEPQISTLPGTWAQHLHPSESPFCPQQRPNLLGQHCHPPQDGPLTFHLPPPLRD